MEVAYRGTEFRGFTVNPGLPSVEAVLVDAIRRVLRHDVQLIVAGRTDRGVHASGQVVSFDTTAEHFEPTKLRQALNKIVGPHVAVRSVEEVDADFHARFSATGRRYRYRVLVSDVADPLRADLVWCVPDLDSADELNRVAGLLPGAHDFSGFCRRPKSQPEASLIRRVFEAGWESVDDEFHFVIYANAFCQQMVRAIVGTSVEIARNRVPPDLVEQLLETGDRSLAPEVAPPQGLTLIEVTY